MNEPYLREADINDADILYQWRNDTAVRNNSFNSNVIQYEEHQAWLGRTLQDPSECLYVLMDLDVPVGQVRLSCQGTAARISYSIGNEYCGQGYGSIILQLAENEMLRINPQGYLLAQVKKNNIASQRIFEKLGYICNEEEAYYEYSKLELRSYIVRVQKFSGGGTVLNQ